DRRQPDNEADDAEDEDDERLLEAEGALTDVKPGDVDPGFAARTGCGLVPSLPIDVIVIDLTQANQGHHEGNLALPSGPDWWHLGRGIDIDVKEDEGRGEQPLERCRREHLAPASRGKQKIGVLPPLIRR